MNPIKELSDLWPIVVGFLGFIVWLVRLEGRITQFDRDRDGTKERIAAFQLAIDTLRDKHQALDIRVMEELSRMRESLARIEGALGVNN